MQWDEALQDIEDLLFPKFQLNVWERSLYYLLLRRTRGSGLDSALVSIEEIGRALQISESKAHDTIRSLAEKGPISFDRSRKGHLVRVALPAELELSRPTSLVAAADLEATDFFAERRYAFELVQRELDRCFYCLREISAETCELDHVVAKANGGSNSYRNIVAACHDCNSLKQDQDPKAFLRSLFRKNILSDDELQSRFDALASLQDGRSVPRI